VSFATQWETFEAILAGSPERHRHLNAVNR
jgi:hypothetical protein